MILIGEKLNSSIPSTQKILEARDQDRVADLVQRQADAGADWLDLNAGMFLEKEADLLRWMAGIAAETAKAGLVLDSPDPGVLEAVAPELEGRSLMLNSVTLEPDRFRRVTELALRLDASLIAMPVQGKHLPSDLSELEENAETLISALNDAGIGNERIYLDVIVSAAAVDADAPLRSLELAKKLRATYADLHLTAGVSNVSFGLPKRKSLNMAYLANAVLSGIDAPILDVLDSDILLLLAAARVMAGQDEYCMDYLGQVRGNG